MIPLSPPIPIGGVLALDTTRRPRHGCEALWTDRAFAFNTVRETDHIVPLSRFFIEHYNRKFKRSIHGLSDVATKQFLIYDWPGNVRELRNAIERGMILEESALITSSSLPIDISRLDGPPPQQIPACPEGPSEWTALEASERILLARPLEQTRQPDSGGADVMRLARQAAI